MDHRDAVHQWFSAEPQGFLSRYQLVATYRVQYCRVVVTIASELALDLQVEEMRSTSEYEHLCTVIATT